MINFIKKVISYQSVDRNIKTIHLCMDEFEEKASPFFTYKKRYVFREKPILVLSTHDTLNFDLIISGHIDVVPGPEDLFTAREDDENLYGRGTYDMKAPLASAMFGVIDYLRDNKNTSIKVAFIITADEEVDGLSVRYVAKDLGYSSHFALIPDGGSLDEVVVEQKGFWQFKLRIPGKSAHASRPWSAVNPFLRLNALLTLLQEKFPIPKDEDDWLPSLTLTKVVGGSDSLNTIPHFVEAYFDVRFTKKEQKEKIEQIIHSYDSQIVKEDVAFNDILSVDLEKNNFGKIFLERLQKNIGENIILRRESGTSDAVFFAENGTPTVLFRPIGGDIHLDTEWVQKESLFKLREIIKDYLYDLSR